MDWFKCFIFLCSLFIANQNRVLGHIPYPQHYVDQIKYYVDHYEFAEPIKAEYVSYDGTSVRREDNSFQRLAAVREQMNAEGVDAYIVPSVDAHNSQYIAPSDARRAWLSGLQGSSGTVVVTPAVALVWTDSRYFTQFEMQVNTTYFSLMRQGTDLSIQSWLVQNMTSGAVVGVDPTTYTRSAWISLETALANINVTLKAVPQNLVDLARAAIGDPPPPRPNNALIPVGVNFTGRKSSEKISELFALMGSRNASALVLSALDDIAYTLNIRGSDIPYNPVFFSYLVLRADLNTAILFWGNGVLAANITQHLTSEGTQIQVKPYSDIFGYLESMVNSPLYSNGATVWLSQIGSHALFNAVESNGTANILSTLSPVQPIKAVKNDVELLGFRSAHIKDGIAVVRTFRWLEEQVAAGAEVTEINVSDKLEEMRRQEADSHGPSFTTIAGAGEHGAVIHYSPSREGPQRVIKREDMLLVDSGGQYKDGTTDITRTRHMSAEPTPAQRQAFTRVLKGQIMLATAVFPKGTVGHHLETFARKYLWDVGLNYAHGTGHGVGHFLNVHEGPSGISSSPIAGDPGILPGMIFSNEPGYYEVGEYGIRHEDLVEVIEMSSTADHIAAKDLVGDFHGAGALGFYTISLVPHQTACLNVSLLTDFEIQYLNDYHTRVLNTLGPILKERNLIEDYNWLERECAPLSNAAILAKASSILIVSLFSLWYNV